MTNIGKQKILLVDDRPENLLALENLLMEFDLDIIKAQSGSEALGLTLEHDFALVLLDVQMPEIDGFETAELMRGCEKTRNIPIIFVTAISYDEEHIFKGYETGAVDYLYKPINPFILQSKVNAFCELHRQKMIIQSNANEIKKKNDLLQKQLIEIKKLKGLLPICASCKKIRKDDGYWEVIEKYISEHSEADFSHSVCPDCIKTLYPEQAEMVLKKMDERGK
ncbi:MAG: response regulator [Candidatus Anammoxibacter sp.]